MKRLWYLPKILFVFLFMQAILVGKINGQVADYVVLANSSQGNQEGKVASTLVPLEQLLDNLEKKYDVTFLYQSEVVDGKYLESSQMLLSKITGDKLALILDETKLGYSQLDEETYVLFNKDKTLAQPTPFLQTVTGTVTDANDGATLPGVNISISGTTQGTSTNAEGEYELYVPSLSDSLIFSFVGYETQVVPIDGRTTVDVELESSVVESEELVVTAFGEQERQEVVGSVTSVTPEMIKVPSSDLTSAFAGRMAGIISYQRSGEPGQDNTEFFIRGVTTFGYKKDPLILIDGLELTSKDLARLQPDDIESFSIMKDAASTALYGARGANGVISVTTKEGFEGSAKVDVRFENSISTTTTDVQLADPVTYMKMHNEAVLTRNPLGATPYSRSKIENTEAGANPYAYPAVDWKDMLFKDYTLNQRGNFSVSGGGQVAQYYLSGSFSQDNGVLKVDNRNNFNNNIDFKTYLLRSNVDINLTPTTKVGVKLYGSFDDYTGPIDGGEQMYRNVMRSNPALFPAYFPADEDHQYVNHILFGNYEEGNYLNPYADMVRGYRESTRSLMLAQFEVRQDLDFLTEGLYLRAMGNTNRESEYDVNRHYDPFWYQVGFYDRTSGDYNISQINPDGGTEYLGWEEGPKDIVSNLYIESTLNYRNTFLDRHGVSAMLVFIMSNKVVANAGSLQESLPFRNRGLSGRITYNYDSRYFGEFNFGYNGSERFYKTERYGFFPSGGVSWYISNEDFWEPYRDVVSDLKIRATYGLVGNDQIGAPDDRFFYLSQVNMQDGGRSATFGTNNDYSRNGVSLSRYQNKLITWEQAKKINLGLELGLFERLNINADFYREHRTNILMDRSFIPSTMGLSADIRANVGEATGQGMDISADYNQPIGNNAWISARGNFTYATNAFKVYEEPDYEEEYLSRIGYPIDQQWGYIAERLFVDGEEVENSPRQNFGDYMGGDIKYRDVNGDGQITTLDRVPIGHPTVPEIVYGFGFSLGYKEFDVSAFFQGSARSSFWIDPEATAPFVSYRYYSGEHSDTILQNALLQSYADDHWSEDNRDIYALWPRLDATGNSANNTQRNTWFMRNGAFLRLKQVEVGYNLPVELQSKFGLSRARVYVNGTNLLTFSKFKMWDVEMGGNGLGYPIQRVVNLGIQLSF